MKQTRKNPCNECPFRKKSIAGWLGPWTVQSILQQAHGEAGLGCHVDVEKKKNLSDEELVEKVHICVGSIQHANKSFKSYRNPELRKMQDELGEGEDILNLREFYLHHGGKK